MTDAFTSFLNSVEKRSARPPAPPAGAVWGDLHRSAEERADALVAELTLEEKTGLLHGRGLKVSPEMNVWQAWVQGVDRVGIPDVTQGDSPDLPLMGPNDATQIPSELALGASFDPDNARRAAGVLGQQVHRVGYGVWHAPTMDVTRDPRHGRSHENFGEDPHLVSMIGQGYTEGLQNTRVVADVKHFGMNAVETDRHSADYLIDHDRLIGHYLAPFRSLLANADIHMVMTAYAKINGHHVNDTGTYFDLLRNDWGFEGVVRNDAMAVHTLSSLGFGLDQEFREEEVFGRTLRDAVASGEVPLEVVDRAVHRILVMMIRTGLFDEVPVPEEWTGPTPEELHDAQTAAAQSLVLLKNADDLLPLPAKTAERVAVFGPTAVDTEIAGGPTRHVDGRDTFLEAIATSLPDADIDHHAIIAPIALTDQLPGYDEFPAELLTFAEGAGPTIVFFDADGSVIETRRGARAAFHSTNWAVGEVDPALSMPEGTARATLSGIWVAEAGLYGLDVATGGSATVRINRETVLTHDGGGLIFSRTACELQLRAGRYEIDVDYTAPDESARAFVDASAAPLKIGLRLPAEIRLPRFEAAARVAADADVAMVVVRDFASEGWDRMSLRLPGRQDELIAAVAAANPRTIVVLQTSSAVLTPWRDDVAAILQGWYGGSRGNSALADAIVGAVDPGGRLPVTFPAHDEDLPTFPPSRFPGVGKVVQVDEPETGYRYFSARSAPDPAYPFGFGLSYASHALGALTAPARAAVPADAAKSARRREHIPVTVHVANTSARAGRVVPQLYALAPGADVATLVAFTSVDLAAGQEQEIDLSVAWADLAHYKNGQWSIPLGRYELRVGISARDITATTYMEVI
ncbi:glycoside hydrolase family 3 C-terminal domain-containing protein [Microbacteriaceae bacterium VKM Ac-2855]|nr:glycoside hydrolase family 3 C-terminal domain-containing protein [Microbacteriaceae bacterium VKM Ac-2855]